MKKELSITLKVDAKTGQVNAVKNSFDDLDRKVSQTNNNTSSFKSTLMGLAGATVVVMGISKAFELAIGQAESFLDTGSKFEQHTNQLSAFYVGQEKLNEALAMAREFSKEFNVSIDETADAMKLMKRNGIDASIESLEYYGNVAKGSGKTIEQFVEAVADAFMMENERLKEFGVKASVQGKKVAYAWTDSMGKARSVVIDGNQKTIESTLKAIYNEKYVGQMAKYAGSWSGFIQGIKTDYENFQIDVMSAGLLEHIELTSKAFYLQWSESFGNSKETARDFSDYLIEKVDDMAKGVAFLIDTWTGMKLVWASLKVAFWGVVVGIGESINWIGDLWDDLTVLMHNAWKSTVDGIGEAFAGSTNFIINKINSIIEAVMNLGNDALEFLGIDPIAPLKVSTVEYQSTIEKAVKSTEKLVNFDYSNNALADAVHDVVFAYDELENHSAQSFVDEMIAKRIKATAKATKTTDELTEKTKEAKDALAELLELHSGKLPESIKKGSTAQKAQNALLKEAKQLEQERIKKTNSLVKEAKQLERERVKEAKVVAKAWDDTYDAQMKGFEEFTKNKNEAYKEYLRIMGDFEKLAKIENAEKVVEIKPYLSAEKVAEAAKKLEELSELPSFKDGIADAFGVDTNASLKENISQLKYDLGTIASDLFVGLLKDYQQTGDIGQSIQNMTDDNAVGNAFMASGNPYLMAASLAGSVIGDALSEPLDEFQAAQANVHKDNQSIAGSLSILESVAFPNLKVAKESWNLLIKISSSFEQIGRQVSYGSSSGFVLGTDFVGSRAYNGNQDIIEGGNLFGNLFGDDNIVGELHTSLFNAILGETTESLTDSGIRNEAQLGLDFINNNTAEGYQNIETEESYLFGIINGTSTRTETQELPSDVIDRFAQIYADGWESILELGISLGYDSDSLTAIFSEHLTEPMKLALKDATDEEIVQYLRGWFGNEFDAIIQEALPRIAETFQMAGESSTEALTRVATTFESANYSIGRLGFDMVEFSNIVDNVDLANLNADTRDFIDGFYSLSEQTELDRLDLIEAFSTLGMSVPETREEFRELVEGLDLTTEEGRRTYSMLMQTSGQFDAYATEIENLSDKVKEGKVSFVDFFATFDMNDIEKINYNLANAIGELGLGSINLGNYFSVLQDATAENIEDIEAIGELLMRRYDLERQHEEQVLSEYQGQLDLVLKIKKNASDAFSEMYATSIQQKQSLFFDALNDADYERIQGSFADYASAVKESNLSDMDAYIKIAYANKEVQGMEEPKSLSPVEEVARTTSSFLEDFNAYGSADLQNSSVLISSFSTLLAQNNIEPKDNTGEIIKGLLSENSSIYNFLEQSLKTQEFILAVDTQTFKQVDAVLELSSSFDNYGQRIDFSIAKNKSATEELEIRLEKMIEMQKETNLKNEEIIRSLQEQISLNRAIVENTAQSIIGDLK